MSLTSPDFESGAYTNFATPAVTEDNKASSFVAQPHPPHLLTSFNQVSSFVRHLLAFGSLAGETPALPAMRSELCWTMRADERKDREAPNQARAKMQRSSV